MHYVPAVDEIEIENNKSNWTFRLLFFVAIFLIVILLISIIRLKIQNKKNMKKIEEIRRNQEKTINENTASIEDGSEDS